MPRQDLISLRGGPAATWTEDNPTLDLYEPGWEADTGKWKVGDGVTAWTALAYAGSGAYVPTGKTFFPEAYGAIGYPTVAAAVASGTDNTTAINECFAAAVAAGGQAQIDALYYPCNESPTITGSLDVLTKGVSEVGFDDTMPVVAPFLSGSVLLITGAGVNGLTSTATAPCINIPNGLGILFAPSIMFTNTGHGFYVEAAAAEGSGHAIGLQNSTIVNLKVFGHDGNHYGRYLVNPLLNNFIGYRSYGGGVSYVAADSNASIPGNSVHAADYGNVLVAGSAHGFAHSCLVSTPGTVGNLNLIEYLRPQANFTNYSSYAALGHPAVPTTAQYLWNDSLGAGVPSLVSVYDVDLESDISGQSQPYSFGAGTVVYGSALLGGTSENGFQQALPLVLGPHGNTAGGHNTPWNVGQQNTTYGYGALASLQSGSNNITAFGYNAGGLATVTGQDVFVGAGAGVTANPANATTTGFDQTLVGYNTGQSTTTQLAKIGAFGYQALCGGNYAYAMGTGASAGAAGAVAIGSDHTGAGASTTTQDQIVLGTALHSVLAPGSITSPTVAASGTTGAALQCRLVGAVNGAAPTTGTYQEGDIAPDVSDGNFWLCTTAGTPGSWTSLSQGATGPTGPTGAGAIAPSLVTANGSVSVPSGAGHAVIKAVGAGGGGAGGGAAALTGGTSTQVGGSGAGAGQYVEQVVSLSGVTTLTVGIGAAGTGGNGGAASSGVTGNAGSGGVAGGNTTVTGTGISVTAYGGGTGVPGAANSATTVNAGAYAGVAEGGHTISAPYIPGCGGTALSTAGAGGGPGIGLTSRGGGGGAPATASLGGVAGGALQTSASTGSSTGGSATNAPANSGQGGDGGGGGAPGGAGGNGSNGGSGFVLIEWLP